MDRESDGVNVAAGDASDFSARRWALAFFEVLAILALFAAAGAWPVPDVNETAYLTKARHGANPSWGGGDFFLETPGAHGLFYRLMGPLAAAVTLEQAAWIGRWLGWLILACGFRWATIPLLTAGVSRVAAAAIFSLALRQTTAAGEWVIGGCEAKVFAWAFVLVAVGEIGRGRWASAWLSLGAATALHPIVGGWGMAALVPCLALDPAASAATSRRVTPSTGGLLLERIRLRSSSGFGAAKVPRPPLRRRIGSSRGQDSPKLRELSPTPSPTSPDLPERRHGYAGCFLVAAGLLLAVVGVMPVLGLSAGADAATRAAAARIHVVERLPHHLLIRSFAPGMVGRHVLAIAVWWLLRRLADGNASGTDSGDPRRAARVRVDRFILAALCISLAGCAISMFEPVAATTVYSLLRFYWFRLADVLVPFGLATAAASVLASDSALRALVPARPLVVRVLVAGVLVFDLAMESRHWPLAGRTGLVARSDMKVDAAAWRDICEWIVANTPSDACFVTPRGAASFTWLTGRREVVSWKNSPQDAASLVAWRQRFTDCFSHDGSFANMERSTAAIGADRLRLVASRYDATYAIIPRDVTGADSLPFERLHANRGFVVYSLE